MPFPINPLMQSIFGAAGPTPEAPLPMRPTLRGELAPTLDLPDRTPAEQADWQNWWDHKDDTAYSAPGGYHPRGDILELRGDIPSLTSAYGVQVPSNAALGRKYAAREQVGFQKQKLDAETSAAATEAAKAKALADDLIWKRSPEGQSFGLRNVGIQAGNAALTDQAVRASAGPSPFEALGGLSMASRPELLPKDYDELVRQYAASGGPELDLGGELGQALRGLYGPIVDARAAGLPFNTLERFGWNAPPRPQLFRRPGLRSMVGPPAPVRTPVVLPAPTPDQQRREDEKRTAMRMF